jgi:hypothetical protein
MKKAILTFISCILAIILHAQVETLNPLNKDSICGRQLIRNGSSEVVLGWFKPQIPGATYDHVVNLASEFIKNTPIEPKTGLPMYLVTCCFDGPHMTPQKNIVAEHWPHNPACVYAAMVQSLAIQYRTYSGDSTYLRVVQNMLDYQLDFGTTPDGWDWSNVPYASADPFSKTYQGATEAEKIGRGDGFQGIEPDKIGELGYAYLRYYEITNKTRYLEAAIHCADALAKHIRVSPLNPSTFATFNQTQSPWPFRVNARNGIVISQYCSNVLEPIKLLTELVRIQSKIGLLEEKSILYQKTIDSAWNWMYCKAGPMTTFIWNGYFEDIPNDPETANRVQNTPIELCKYLIDHPNADKNIDTNVPSLIHWVANAFKTDAYDAIKEQTWCYEPMGSHTARYGSACAMYYERTGDPWYKDQAYRFLNVATYMTYDNGVVAVGPTWLGSWFIDGYGDYIRHFLDAMAAIPEWAPAGEDHLLKSTSVIQSIKYMTSKITFTTFDDESKVTLRLASKPKGITLNGKSLKQNKTLDTNNWTWTSLDKGGIARINYSGGNRIELIQ